MYLAKQGRGTEETDDRNTIKQRTHAQVAMAVGPGADLYWS